MKKLCFSFLMIVLLCLAGYFNPAFAAQDLRNSGGSYSQYSQQTATQSNMTAQKAPPGPPISGLAPIGSGLSVLIGLSFCYLSYIVLTNSKKEEK